MIGFCIPFQIFVQFDPYPSYSDQIVTDEHPGYELGLDPLL